MKTLEFETSKGRFLVVDMDFESVLDKYKGLKFTFMYPLKHISELEASEIVDYSILKNLYSSYNYGVTTNSFVYKTAVESLHSLLKSKGIHLFDNPFGSYQTALKRHLLTGIWAEAEQKIFYNHYIFKL